MDNQGPGLDGSRGPLKRLTAARRGRRYVPPPTAGGAGLVASPGRLTGQELGGYRLTALIGTGGMAEVYRADDRTLHRAVAVKVLASRFATDPNYVARFRTEARRAAGLHHPYLAPVYGYGEQQVEGKPVLYLVMPLLARSLRDKLAHEGRLAPVVALQVAHQIAEGLQAVHALGLIHRDVKPENILLDPDGHALLGDFGIARELQVAPGHAPTLAGTGLPVGTPEYMAPEQLRSGIVDQRCDIYALGVVLYELLTGLVPFTGETPHEVAANVLSAPLVPPSIQTLGISAPVERVVLTAMARDPAHRYATAAEMAQALQEAGTAAASSTERVFGVYRRSSGARVAALPLADQPTKILTAVRSSLVGKRISARRTVILSGLALIVVLVAASIGVLLQHVPSGSPTPSASAPTSNAAHSLGTLVATASPATAATPILTATTAAGQTGISLEITPTPLALAAAPHDSRTCSATQTITNRSDQRVGWAWQPPAAPGVQFRLNGGVWGGWPTKQSFLAPGSSDKLDIQAMCKHTTRRYDIVVIDTANHHYTFTMTIP